MRISCIAPAIDDLWGNLVLFPGLSGITLTHAMIIVVINCLYIYFLQVASLRILKIITKTKRINMEIYRLGGSFIILNDII